ncbi:MAG: type II toxin-antitoxin system RelE/ParE family toxin [Gammaproteobacteria bacterium]|nr:type II toxin-antitoxin system RelE/ParE family toxin [Gammaproteobacteria bacterium]
MRLVWKPLAQEDRARIMDYIASENPQAAFDLDESFKRKAEQLLEHPKLHKIGRLKGTREAVVHPNYIMGYTVDPDKITILRVLHSAQKWE